MFDFFKKKREAPPIAAGVVRRHYLFFGRVQFVGFRYQAKYAAEFLGVTGWVLNREDGSVEMEAQGLPEHLDQVINDLQHREPIEITGLHETEIPVVPEETRFRVRG